MEQQLQNKKGLVEKVFDKVFDRYDLMNDFMSLGVHRFWKKDLINMMAPMKNKKLIDVACGTGDIAKLYLKKTKNDSTVFNIDSNENMINQGKKKFKDSKNITWEIQNAEKLNFDDNDYPIPKTWKLKIKKELRFPSSFYGVGYNVSKISSDE